jgi:hypothetical protein
LPSSPRGFFCWAASVAERYQSPHSPRYEYTGGPDHFKAYRREDSISIRMLAERASHSVSGNGIGYALLTRFYLGEASWYSFTEHEQYILRKTIRDFSRRLREAKFLPDPKDGEEVDRGV